MKNTNHPKPGRRLPALVAVGGSLAALPAAAVELGELTVHSRLGDPLRASIAVALGPNEVIDRSCVSVVPVANGWPGIGAATVAIGNGVVTVTGNTPMREPMVSTRLVVNCPYSANISREYMLFIDPPTYEAPPAANVQPSAAATAPVVQVVDPAVVQSATAETAPSATQPVVTDIPMSGRIQVPVGATASELVQRIEGRTMGLWPAVYALVEANPDAFINGDPNQLKAGSWLDIPASIGGAPVAETAATTEPVAETPVVTVETPVGEITEAYDPAATAVESAVEPVVDESADTTADLMPGDIIETDNPFVETQVTSEATTVIPDTQLEGPQTTASSPNGPTMIITDNPAPTEGRSWAWVYWLGGAGLAAILGLLFFGRLFRKEPEPFAPASEHPLRRASDTEKVEALIVEESDYDIDDDSPTEENLVLDADLITGSGLEQGTEMDVNQDFGFAATTELDVELPFEPVPSIESDETDILPPPRIEESSILQSEVLPEDDEDDYDMSVIVDATKMPQVEEVTERDLKAVEIAPDDETMIAENNYTISKEVDYEILEQDYEDELTATQALNEEIARAAAELAERMEDEDGEDLGETAALPLASVTELDVTAEMPAANSDEVVELDATAQIPVDSDGDDDATTEMQIEGGKSG